MPATYATLADPVTSVVNVINNNWDGTYTSAVGGAKPTINASWDLGKLNLRNGDIIRCYEVSGGHDILGIGKGLDKHTASIAIDISTATSRERLRALYQAVVHIIHAAHSKSASVAPLDTAYASIRLLSRTDQSDKLRRWYRYVLNCEITSYEVVN
tara:strand:- start:32 stop:499 length:468 start_codon:yes stop_codon:yes gene_type:complete